TKGIEVGHIFKLGTVYSAPLKAEYLDENGRSQPFIMGTYGMGVSRLVAAVIEQHHDEKGCIWTPATAPYLVNVMVSNIKEESHMQYGENLYAQLQKEGIEAILDDRKERFGFKMSDAELIGFPYTVIVGKELDNGSVQIMIRATREIITVGATEVIAKIRELVK
ncbi:MAG: His/Gly/Thr/Pro-type tRNA ligase C-terminal domain-containing protein, partial [Sulfuricurvum sp.]